MRLLVLLSVWFVVVTDNVDADAELEYFDGIDKTMFAGIGIPTHLGAYKDTHLKADSKAELMEFGILKSLLDEFVDGKSAYLRTTAVIRKVSPSCASDTAQVLHALKDGNESYALKMLDAETKIPSGILQGKWVWFGAYEECLEVKSPPTTMGGQITGKYCMAATGYKLGTQSLMLGICIPSSCSASDAQLLVNYVYVKLNRSVEAAVMCEEEYPYSHGAKAALAVCGIIIVLVAIGTMFDLSMTFYVMVKKEKVIGEGYANVNEANEGEGRAGLLNDVLTRHGEPLLFDPPRRGVCHETLHQVVLSFSLLTNTRKLMSTSTGSGQLTSLNGMRVLSMWWVILGHSYLFASMALGVDNVAETQKIIQRFGFQAIMNGTFSVDTFFFLSGLLVTYLCLKNMRDNDGKVNWVLFYFHRFWRLTPVYAFCIMLWGALFLHTLSGPLTIFRNLPALQKPFDECSRSWWANLLYINNFYPYMGDVQQQCMGWSWYLANDMQFYIISPVIIILLYRKRYIGLGVCGALTFSCIFIRIMTAFAYGIHIPGNTPTKHKDNYYGQHDPLYNKMYTRIAPYIVGMVLGYILHRTDCRVRLSKLKCLIGWCFAIATGLSVVYGLYDYYHHSYLASLATSVIYIGFSRFAWSLALAWVVFACATGHGGLVNSILSWGAWAPLGRLTYCAYLIHPMVIEYYAFAGTSSFHITDINMIYVFLGNLVLSYCAAYMVSMAVEAPMLGLEKAILKRR